MDHSKIESIIKSAKIDGFSGRCGMTAIAINKVLFGGNGLYIAGLNTYLMENHDRYVGHISVLYDNKYWDANGTIYEEDLIAWGMLDHEDPDYDLPSEDAGYGADLYELTEQEVSDKFGDWCSVEDVKAKLINSMRLHEVRKLIRLTIQGAMQESQEKESTMRSLKDLIVEAKPKGSKAVRKKAEKEEVAKFIESLQRLKELSEAAKEYRRISDALRKGKHGQSMALEFMRRHFAEAFQDQGDAYDDTMDAVLRLEKIALRMKSKKSERGGAARVLEILLEDADPIVQEAIERAQESAEKSKKVFYTYDWEIVESANKYGLMQQESNMMMEGLMDKLKELGKDFMRFVKGNTKWFQRAAPKLSSIATEAESSLGNEALKRSW